MADSPRTSDPAASAAPAQRNPSRFRATLVRVLLVQALTLALLWALQAGFGR